MPNTKIKAQAELAYAIYTDFSEILSFIKKDLQQITITNQNKIYINQIQQKLETANNLLKQLKNFSKLNF